MDTRACSSRATASGRTRRPSSGCSGILVAPDGCGGPRSAMPACSRGTPRRPGSGTSIASSWTDGGVEARVIQGRKVQLRPVEESDLPLLRNWRNHPEVWRYMDYEKPYSLADVRDDVEQSRSAGEPFTILVDGRPIGRIGLNQFNRRDRR